MKKWLLNGLFVVVCAVLCVFIYRHHRAFQTVDRAQAAFEQAEPDWNWQGWRDEQQIRCAESEVESGVFSRTLLRTCVVNIWLYANPVTGDQATQSRYMIFVCSPEACTWVLGPWALNWHQP